MSRKSGWYDALAETLRCRTDLLDKQERLRAEMRTISSELDRLNASLDSTEKAIREHEQIIEKAMRNLGP